MISNMITWDDTYSVGDEKLDKQHQQLFGLNSALQKYGHIPDRKFVGKIIMTLNDYIEGHFHDEELYMMRIKFPQFGAHQKQHHAFVQKVREFEAAFNKGDESVSNQLTEYLKAWLANHILVYDIAYHKFADNKLGTL
jgi:hemerythrin